MKNLVFVTDIFGESTWIDSLAVLTAKQVQSQVISPYTFRQNFKSETESYQAFTQAGGMEAYVIKVEAMLSTMPKKDTLFIGFSAGAAALWKVLADKESQFSKCHFVGFYPGQIRHYLDLEPKIETSLIFPKNEQHFELMPVISALIGKANTLIWQNDLQHGYVNPSSDNFDLQASQEVVGWCENIDKLFTANTFSRVLRASQRNYQSLN
jgi:dienelactone hydrolase